MEDLVAISLNDGNDDDVVQIGSNRRDEVGKQLVAFIQRNVDVFAWIPMDMPEIDAEVMKHHLAIDPKCQSVKEKMCGYAPKRQKAIMKEDDKLLKAGFIREVSYPNQISNVLLVRNANDKWKMCIDFKILNKTCPKDSYPRPNIDQLVDATSGHELLTFMVAFSSYNQIRMAPEDKKKISFITEHGLS